MRPHHVALAAVPLALLAACAQGEIGDHAVGGGPVPKNAGNDPVCATSKNDEVRLLLEPTCGGCHKDGSNKPFFTSLRAFESLLVYDPVYVVSESPRRVGSSSCSRARRRGSIRRCRPRRRRFDGGRRQDQDLARGHRRLITHLPPEPPENRAPDPSAVTVRRVEAEEMTTALLSSSGSTPTRTSLREDQSRASWSNRPMRSGS